MLPRAQYFWGGTVERGAGDPRHGPSCHDDGPSPLDYARRFYYDSMVFDRRALRYLIDLLGHDRLLVGSDFPAMHREEPAGRTLRSMDLPEDVLDRHHLAQRLPLSGHRPARLAQRPPGNSPKTKER